MEVLQPRFDLEVWMSENKKETNPAQPFIDSSLKALYAAAGLTDLLAERFREYAEAKQEEARTRQVKAREQFAQATEKAQEMMTSMPQMAQAWPEQVQKQLDDMLKDLNLSFEEMVRRGEARLADLRTLTGGQARFSDRQTGTVKAQDAAAETAEPVSTADVEVVESVDAAETPSPADTETRETIVVTEADAPASEMDPTKTAGTSDGERGTGA